MLTGDDVIYFKKRAAEERERVALSQDAAVRSAHFQLAERYADAARSAEERFHCSMRADGLWRQPDAPTGEQNLFLAVRALD